MTRHLPNLLTCCNLLCGSVGIVFVFEGNPIPAAYFVWAAGIFDFLDGFTARLLNAKSSIGKELDSLADMVSFGVLPSAVIYKLWITVQPDYTALLAFSIAVFSALRLAKFNIDDRQSDTFIGLPTPANAFLITSLPLLHDSVKEYILNPWVMASIVAVSSFLLVSPLRLFALKFKDYTWTSNKIRYIFLLLTIGLIAVFKVNAIPLIILAYIGLSLGEQAFSRS